MLLPAGTLRVSQTLPPMIEPRPMVTRPSMVAPHTYVVLDDRMARLAFDELRRSLHRKAFRAERHRLIEAHALADDRRLADDDAGAVVDEESDHRSARQDGCRCRLGVRELGDDAAMIGTPSWWSACAMR